MENSLLQDIIHSRSQNSFQYIPGYLGIPGFPDGQASDTWDDEGFRIARSASSGMASARSIYSVDTEISGGDSSAQNTPRSPQVLQADEVAKYCYTKINQIQDMDLSNVPSEATAYELAQRLDLQKDSRMVLQDLFNKTESVKRACLSRLNQGVDTEGSQRANRGEKSKGLANITERMIRALYRGPRSRKELCDEIGAERRRISTILSIYKSVGLVSLLNGDGNKVHRKICWNPPQCEVLSNLRFYTGLVGSLKEMRCSLHNQYINEMKKLTDGVYMDSADPLWIRQLIEEDAENKFPDAMIQGNNDYEREVETKPEKNVFDLDNLKEEKLTSLIEEHSTGRNSDSDYEPRVKHRNAHEEQRQLTQQQLTQSMKNRQLKHKKRGGKPAGKASPAKNYLKRWIQTPSHENVDMKTLNEINEFIQQEGFVQTTKTTQINFESSNSANISTTSTAWNATQPAQTRNENCLSMDFNLSLNFMNNERFTENLNVENVDSNQMLPMPIGYQNDMEIFGMGNSESSAASSSAPFIFDRVENDDDAISTTLRAVYCDF